MNIQNRRLARTALCAAMLVALAACSGKNEALSPEQVAAPASTPAAAPANSLLNQAAQHASVQAKQDNLPKPDLSVVADNYAAIDKGQQVMFLATAFSGPPPDYDKMAQIYSSEYRNANDTFRKHDLLSAIQPRLDAGIAQAKEQRYVWVEDNNPNLAHYDFNKKSFHNNSPEFAEGGYYAFSDAPGYNLAFTNGSAFQDIPVADEIKARAIESDIGRYPSLKLKIFAFVQSTDVSGTPTAQAVITRVQILDPHGALLAEQTVGN